jgi:hypothetical protein
VASLYTVFLISDRGSLRAWEFRTAFRREVVALGLPAARIAVRTGVPRRVGRKEAAVCLYFASRALRTRRQPVAAVQRVLDAGLPVFPIVGAREPFTGVVPGLLHPFNALRWDGPLPAARVTSHVLRALGLAEQQRRVFISYRRADALYMAEQLWETLSKRGFQVFLDRFGVAPGADFQRRLFEALDDKSFVLLLESPGVSGSPWVDAEVQYARKQDMGFAALTWPQTVAQNRRMPGVVEDYRLHIPPKSLVVDRRGQGRLRPAFLARVLERVESRHAKAFVSRRRRLMGSVRMALRTAGIRHRPAGEWSVAAAVARGGRRRSYLITVTPRPPEIPDLHTLDRACGAPRTRGILVHNRHGVTSERTALITWAISRRQLRLVSDDRIVTFAATL